MASTTLTVTVNGGISPLSILVDVFKDDITDPIQSFKRSASFIEEFTTLTTGSNYDIVISGFNPSNGNTVVSLSTQEITLTGSSASTPSTQTGESYRVEFNFNV